MKSTIVLAICLFSTTVFAQSFALKLEHFEPVGAPQQNILNVHQSTVLKDEHFALAALFHFSTNTLSASFDSGEERAWIENELSVNISASLGISDFFELGFSLPLILNRSLNPTIQTLKNSKNTYLSDTRLVGKFQLPLDRFSNHFGITIVNTFFLPTGDKNYFSGLGIPRFEPRLVVDFHTEKGHIFALNLARQSYKKRRFKSLVDDGNIKLAVGGQFRFNESLALLGTYSATFANQTTGSEVDTAIRFVRDGWGLMIGAGIGVTNAPGIPDFRTITGFGYATSVSNNDDDGDKIANDKCPRQAEDIDGFEDDDGCPEYDNDADGTLDIEDDCPLQKGNLNNGGCPLESSSPIPLPSPLDEESQ